MAFTVPASLTAQAEAAGTTGITLNKPTGLADDDVLYTVIARDWSTGGDFSCSGWTLVSSIQTTPGRDFNTAVLRKVITDAASEASSYTFTNTDTVSRVMAGIMFIVRGADTTTPEDVAATYSSGQNNDNPDSPAITTVTDGALILAIQCLNNGQGQDEITIGAPTGYTLADSEAYGGSASAWQHASAAYAVKATAGSSGSTSWNNTADDSVSEYHCYKVAVRPASGGGGGSSVPAIDNHYRRIRG